MWVWMFVGELYSWVVCGCTFVGACLWVGGLWVYICIVNTCGWEPVSGCLWVYICK